MNRESQIASKLIKASGEIGWFISTSKLPVVWAKVYSQSDKVNEKDASRLVNRAAKDCFDYLHGFKSEYGIEYTIARVDKLVCARDSLVCGLCYVFLNYDFDTSLIGGQQARP